MMAKNGMARKLENYLWFPLFFSVEKLQPFIRAQGYLQCKLKDLRSFPPPTPFPNLFSSLHFPFLLMGKKKYYLIAAGYTLDIKHNNCRATCCAFSDLAFEFKRGLKWPCFERNLQEVLTWEQRDLHEKSREAWIKTRSLPALFLFTGQFTEHADGKWAIH